MELIVDLAEDILLCRTLYLKILGCLMQKLAESYIQ